MSQIQPVSEGESDAISTPTNPRRNPSYPARIHWGERSYWQGILETWEARVTEAGKKLPELSGQANQEFYKLIYAQMLGGRDQIFESVRRLPGEVGDLYEEDKHRVEQGVAALERLFVRWEKGE